MSLMITTSNPDRPTSPRRVRSALFVDFDNVLGGLLKADPAAARAFAEHPERWASALCNPQDDGMARDLLVRRAYLNPNGWIPDPTSGPGGRIRISQYRGNLTRAGFEVVDCPSLSAQHKNAADIRMVLDVMTALEMPTGFDELIIASSDSDFTPLLHRLRALDRITTILTTGATCAAYRNVAHEVIDTDAVIALTGTSLNREWGTPRRPPCPSSTANCLVDQQAAAASIIEASIGDAPGPVNMARLGGQVHASVGRDVVESTNWFGAGGFVAFLRSLGRGYCARGHVAWDPARHVPPTTAFPAPPTVARFSDTTTLPFLEPGVWVELVAVLSAGTTHAPADESGGSGRMQEQLAARDVEVSRAAVLAAMRLAAAGGSDLCTLSDSATISAAIAASTVAEARVAGWEPSDAEAAELLDWLRGVVRDLVPA